MKAKRWLLSLAVCGVAASASIVSPSRAQPVTEIIVGTSYPGADSMPVYIADQLGYFSAENLKVRSLSLATGDKLVYALLSGSVHIARYTPDWIIRAVEGGARLKIVLGGSNNLVFSLVGAKGVEGYADLKGKRIGVSALAAADATVARKMMAAHGFGPADYGLLQVGSSPERAAALRAGALGATLLSPPEDQRILDDGGFKRLDLSTNVVKNYAWGGQAVREEWAKANRDSLIGYMRAWMKGNRWLRDPANKGESIRILSREARIDEHFARAVYDMYFGPDALPVAADGAIDFTGYEELMKDMVEQRQIGPPTPKVEKFMDTSYWSAARDSLP